MTGRTGRTDHCDRSDRLRGTGLIGLGSRSERSLPVLAKLHILVKISSEIEPIGDIELLGGTCDVWNKLVCSANVGRTRDAHNRICICRCYCLTTKIIHRHSILRLTHRRCCRRLRSISFRSSNSRNRWGFTGYLWFFLPTASLS